jgi:hypothetical protein
MHHRALHAQLAPVQQFLQSHGLQCQGVLLLLLLLQVLVFSRFPVCRRLQQMGSRWADARVRLQVA